MPENRQVPDNALSNQQSDIEVCIVEAVRKLKISDNQDVDGVAQLEINDHQNGDGVAQSEINDHQNGDGVAQSEINDHQDGDGVAQPEINDHQDGDRVAQSEVNDRDGTQSEINDHQNGDGVAHLSLYPYRPGEPDCPYYLKKGLCGYGSNCRYNHPHAVQATEHTEQLPQRVGEPECPFFLKRGTCKYGSTCKYHHPKDRGGAGPISYNTLGLPMRQEARSCPYYIRTGKCKFGGHCKFHHPQPASPYTALPVPGPAFEPAGSSSSGLTHVGRFPTWSSPRMPYILVPHLQGTQTYMPLVLPPSQGSVSAQGWNTYVANMNPMSATSIQGSNLINNSRNQGDLGSGGQVPVSSTPGTSSPERPDQQECWYFMNTGTCKYGSDCRYYHRKERISQLQTHPFGLPSRPGQAVCLNYSINGTCENGPTCKFDHPFAVYPLIF